MADEEERARKMVTVARGIWKSLGFGDARRGFDGRRLSLGFGDVLAEHLELLEEVVLVDPFGTLEERRKMP
jgi:hypothetical protein